MQLQNLKKRAKLSKKGGFTLVEVIVVLVILAILAALLVPSLTTYIDKAKEKTLVTEARMALTGLQTIASEAYGEGNLTDTNKGDYFKNGHATLTGNADAKALAQVKGEIYKVQVTAKGNIEKFVYTSGGISIQYDATDGAESLWTTLETAVTSDS